ncbi:MAG: hypothetical protein D6795_03935 [Deltaproteobacteria bacterium]|nr:MAG: hypothetical protein D6795_03935 [Deltaproteobacteria bacterium]
MIHPSFALRPGRSLHLWIRLFLLAGVLVSVFPPGRLSAEEGLEEMESESAEGEAEGAPCVSYGALELTIGNVGLGLGDAKRIVGVRINYRDCALQRVDGINVTLWKPERPVRGEVNGVALGLPLTEARRIHGLGFGLFGVGSEERFIGIGVGGFGVGAGEDFTGIGVGGFGVGAGQNARGLLFSPVGVGAGESLSALAIGGLGVGAGGNAQGVLLSPLGVGAGGSIRGIAIGGLGVGAPRVRGALLSLFGAGGVDVIGVTFAPAWLRIDDDGRMTGISLAAFNEVRGRMTGLSIGLVNHARSLHGVQLGLINHAGNNPPLLRWLPLLNAHF